MTYDGYKTDNPFNYEDENECNHCGTPCDSSYCSSACKNYDTE